MGPGGQPQRVDCADHRIDQRLRHRLPAEAVTPRRFGIGEHRQVRRRLVQPRKLQGGVETRPLLGISRQRLPVTAGEVTRMAARRSGSSTLTNRHGWLLPTDGASAARPIRRSSRPGRQRLRAEAADVAPPAKQRLELVAELAVERGRRRAGRRRAQRHHHAGDCNAGRTGRKSGGLRLRLGRRRDANRQAPGRRCSRLDHGPNMRSRSRAPCSTLTIRTSSAASRKKIR